MVRIYDIVRVFLSFFPYVVVNVGEPLLCMSRNNKANESQKETQHTKENKTLHKDRG